MFLWNILISVAVRSHLFSVIAVASAIFQVEAEFQSERCTKIIRNRFSRASFTICTFFRKLFWSCGNSSGPCLSQNPHSVSKIMILDHHIIILQVRVYKPEKVSKELKAAREEYLQSNISFQKDKVLIPKLVQNYAKTSGLIPEDLLGIVLCSSDGSDSSAQVQQSRQKRKTSKSVEWIPHNFSFRYLLSSELA